MIPLGRVFARTLTENVVDKGFNLVVQVLGGLDVVEVDQVAWNCTGFGVALRTVSLGTGSGVVSLGSVVFLVVDFAQVEELVQKKLELRVGILLVTNFGTRSEEVGTNFTPADLAVLQ